MTDLRLKERLQKKALDRWENEGGKVFDDQTGEHYSRMRKRGK